MQKDPFCGYFLHAAKAHYYFQVVPKDIALASWRALCEEIVARRINDAGTRMIVAQIES
jgi:hypothetical protein